MLADRQAQPRPAVLAGGGAIGLDEGLKQFSALLGRHADACVADVEPQRHRSLRLGGHRLVQPDAHHHLAPLGKLDGVADQIHQDLAQSSRVASQGGRYGRLHEGAQLQALGVGLFRQQRGHIFHQGSEIEVEDLQVQFAGFDLREVQDVVNDLQQMLAGAADGFRILLLLHRQFRIEQ
ncbi:MAG: hypothetical protein EWM72_02936 [Nitrospira sp.]|nr:MAG: hypothetical protein EWM72_02936 [Nitrospira sp.]